MWMISVVYIATDNPINAIQSMCISNHGYEYDLGYTYIN